MKILTITSSYPKFAGDTTAPFIESITRALAARGHELTMVLPARHDLNPAPIDGVHFHPYRYAPSRSLSVFGYAEAMKADVALRKRTYLVSPLAVVSGTKALWTLSRRERFDCIHAHWVVPSGAMAWATARLGGLPLALSLHGSDVFLSERSRLFGRAARLAFGVARATTACSEDLAERARALGAEPRPVVIPYGVDTVRFRPDRERAAELRHRLGLGETQPVIFSVGRLVSKKGFEYLVDALAILSADHPGLMVILGGGGDLKPALAARARERGVGERLRLVGNLERDELPAYFALATAVAVPSVRDAAGNLDGLPNVLLEAMASASAIVASEVAGIPQAVRDGEDGLLVPEKDPRALAAALDRLLQSKELRASLGGSARERAEEAFGWDRTGERYESVLGAVAETGGA